MWSIGCHPDFVRGKRQLLGDEHYSDAVPVNERTLLKPQIKTTV